MSILDKLFGRDDDDSTRLETAEDFIHENSALYRHYCIEEVQGHVEQFTGVELSDEEAVNIVTRLRSQHGMGPISEWNMPGYVEDGEDDSPTAASTSQESAAPWWKLW